jgi:ATP-dependent DNA helicase RecG
MESVQDDSRIVDISKQERSFDRLQRMGIVAWEQVLLTLPTGYKDYTVINQFLPANATIYPTQKACYALTVSSTPNRAGLSPPRVSFEVTDGCNSARLTVFGDIWAWLPLQVGEDIYVEGIVDVWEGSLQVKNPSLIREGIVGQVLPIYRGKRGTKTSKAISDEFVYDKTRDALSTHLQATADYILGHFTSMDEAFLIRRSGIPYPTLAAMLRAIHAPKKVVDGLKGIDAARSLAAFEVIFNAEQRTAKKPNPKSVINIRQADVDALIARFSHQFTEHQSAGIKDIVDDLRRPYPMNRLLSGDVGFGKTDVALIPAIAAHKVGAKVVVMCPSKLIVDQWVEKIKGYGKDIPVQIVSSGIKIDRGGLADNPIMVGTSALLTRLPKLKWVPNITIIDEQQKQGKNQKDSLVGPTTNRLEATATCQPATAALVNYGGMDETILNQCPVDKRINTRIVHHEEKARLFAHLQRILEELPDSQFAIVYPNVSAGDGKSSLIASSSTWEKKFPGKVGVIHGGLSDVEKSRIIQQMHNKEIRILLSSILIETGITLPSLRGLVVVDADRFGVSALHQLRGRLARHGGIGYFYMYLTGDEIQEETMKRLDLLVAHTDGFVLAEKDAEMRGYGSMGDEDEGQSGVSCSAMFFGMRLMPKDIERALTNSK